MRTTGGILLLLASLVTGFPAVLFGWDLLAAKVSHSSSTHFVSDVISVEVAGLYLTGWEVYAFEFILIGISISLLLFGYQALREHFRGDTP